MKKNKTYTVAQLNKMMHSDLPLWKLIEACAFIDICDCYEPTERPPDGTFDTFKEIEPTLENTSYYVTMPDGTKYFYCGNTRIKVSEHFASEGKPMDKLIENVVRFSAGSTATVQNSMIC